MTPAVWRWGLMPGAALLHVLADNGRTLCNRRVTGEGDPADNTVNTDWHCPVCTRRARSTT